MCQTSKHSKVQRTLWIKLVAGGRAAAQTSAIPMGYSPLPTQHPTHTTSGTEGGIIIFNNAAGLLYFTPGATCNHFVIASTAPPLHMCKHSEWQVAWATPIENTSLYCKQDFFQHATLPLHSPRHVICNV